MPASSAGDDMTTTLITGANKGLGKEAARQLIAAGHTVYLGARDEGRGRAAADELGGLFVRLDVTDDASVDAAAAVIEAVGGLDVLINNAGIEGRLPGNGILAPADTTADDVRAMFETNVFGVVRVTHAFLPLLERSSAPVIVNLSSGLASLTGLSTPGSPTHFYPGVAYPTSKAAVNAITIQFAKAFPGIRINAVEPGFTNTDLNGGTGIQTVEQGAAIIVRMAQTSQDGPTGTFVSAHGGLPW
jgi:NAD(P)-dependent dehydrogenase (short-subunit alcohol dehydrogenase family)